MRNTSDHQRLECLKLANLLATTKVVPPEQVLTLARQFYAFVDGDPAELASSDKVQELRTKFHR